MGTPRNFLAAAMPVLLLLLLVVVIRLLPGAMPVTELAPPPALPDGKRFDPVPPPTMKPADATIRRALVAQATGQITAFRASNFEKALEFSSPGFRSSWTSGRFGEMVKRDFPAFVRPGKLTFGEALVREKMASLEILLTDTGGIESRFMYSFFKDQGSWYVVSCSPMGPPMKNGRPAVFP